MLQRVSRASVRVEGRVVAEIGRGALVLVGVLREDGPGEVQRLARRCAEFRFFAGPTGRMELSVGEAGGEVLVVSQVTLVADGKKGRRPSFDRAAEPERARELYELFLAELRTLGLPAFGGVFRARMEVELVNEGPVTFVLDEPAPADRAGS